jgi:hypothetical protein
MQFGMRNMSVQLEQLARTTELRFPLRDDRDLALQNERTRLERMGMQIQRTVGRSLDGGDLITLLPHLLLE